MGATSQHRRVAAARGVPFVLPRHSWRLILTLLVLVLAGCADPTEPVAGPQVVPTLLPTLPPVAAPNSSATPLLTQPPDDTGWLDAGPGVAIRRIRVVNAGIPAVVSVVRLDPAVVRFDVGYAPGDPRALSTWFSDSNALAAINGGFFDAEYRSTALVISDGQVNGVSYEGAGGMFAVDTAGNVTLRSLAEQPYQPGEPLAEALQSWPLLVNGGAAAYTTGDGERARRSVVALDNDGNVLLIAVNAPAFTLSGLAAWLAGSDLAIATALNLDGGSSTGLYVASGGHAERVQAFVVLPQVLLALPR